MSRYSGPSLKKVKLLGELPGFTSKQAISKNAKGNNFRKKISSYAVRLQEKQKIKFNYGLGEKQLLNYVKLAKGYKGPTGESLLQLLEMRLDNIIFRMGFAPTIPSARQLVKHGHITVNKKRVSIPSYRCKPGDVISVVQKTTSIDLVKLNLSNPSLLNLPPHINLDTKLMEAKINSIVEREWVGLKLNELLVVEYYSRKI